MIFYNLTNLIFNLHLRNNFLLKIENKKFEKIRPGRDSNPQSSAPETDALSIRPPGQSNCLPFHIFILITSIHKYFSFILSFYKYYTLAKLSTSFCYYYWTFKV